MISNWHLAHVTVECPDDYDCAYLGDLEDFADPNFSDDEMDFLREGEFEVSCRCPKCGAKFKITCDAHIDFYVTEGEIENDR